MDWISVWSGSKLVDTHPSKQNINRQRVPILLFNNTSGWLYKVDLRTRFIFIFVCVLMSLSLYDSWREDNSRGITRLNLESKWIHISTVQVAKEWWFRTTQVDEHIAFVFICDIDIDIARLKKLHPKKIQNQSTKYNIDNCQQLQVYYLENEKVPEKS